MGKYSKPATFAGQEQKNTQPSSSQYSPDHWAKMVDACVDVVHAMWEHAGIDVRKQGSLRQKNGKCPYADCSSQEDAFIVWPQRSSKTKNHYHCRRCNRSGDIIKLLQELNGWDFATTIEKLGLTDSSPQIRKPRRETPAQKQEREQQEKLHHQLEWLRVAYECGYMQTALSQYDRPRRYLASRGISVEDARRFDLMYFPAPQENEKPADELMWKWQGRIIFPLHGPDGLTFAGRTLALWQEGMSPDEHKRLVEGYDASHSKRIGRVHKTSPCGWFGYREATSEGVKRLVLVEGEFDALSLLLSGVEDVIAVGTSGFPIELIPLSVETVVIALDADQPGKDAMQRIIFDLQRAGIDTCQVLPTEGKDWNDMLIAGNIKDIRRLFIPSEPEPIELEPDRAISDSPAQPETEQTHPEEACEPATSEPDDDEVRICAALALLEEMTACGLVDSMQVTVRSDFAERVHALQDVLLDIGVTLLSALGQKEIEARVTAVFGPCTETIDPPGYTLADRVAELQAEQGHARTQEDYWTATRRKLAASGYDEQYTHDNAPRPEPPEPIYPAPFPRRERIDGHMRIVGRWGVHGEKLPLE